MRSGRTAIENGFLLANLNSLVLDFLARQFIGGTHVSDFITKQLPILPPETYGSTARAFVGPRVLELTCGSSHLMPFFNDVWRSADEGLRVTITRQWRENWGLSGDELSSSGSVDVRCPDGPFKWDPARRVQLRAELDAWYAHAYGLTRHELRYILDPADVMGDDYPSETFRGLKHNEMKEFGEYRTRRLVLEAWNRMEAGDLK